jgi:hypothetical protein
MEALDLFLLLKGYLILTCTVTLLSMLFPLFKPGTLACGIFGGNAKKGKKLNLRKIAALGLYNIQRGTDSCGYYYNGLIKKGFDKESNFGKFVLNNRLQGGELPCEVFMGHTRKSTHGVSNETNAHPHLVENYVQTHNGVIKNIWEICRKHGIKTTDIHVDSIGLAHIIQSTNEWEVLNEYEGHAALSMTWMDDPTNLYLYHGASRDNSGGTVFEERPLFTLSTPEGLYYSSMEESLDFINESKTVKPLILPHNIVYRVENGEILEQMFKADREDVNIPKVFTQNAHVRQTAKPKELPFNSSTGTLNGASVDDERSCIMRESYPIEYTTGDVYYRRSRYYRKDNILLHGKYLIDRDGKILKEANDSKRSSEHYWFIRGVMMRSEKAYTDLMSKPADFTNLNLNTAYNLSQGSKYPVVAIDGEARSIPPLHRSVWYKSCVRPSTEFKPKWSGRGYIIKNGLLTGVKKAFKQEETFNETEDKTFVSVIDYNTPEDQQAMYDMLYSIVTEWSNKVLTEDTIKSIAEPFLVMVDYYNSTFNEVASTDKQIEAETSAILKDCMKTQRTFRECLISTNDLNLIEMEAIRDAFKDFSVDEVLDMKNRYEFISIEDSIDDPADSTDDDVAAADDDELNLAPVKIPTKEEYLGETHSKSAPEIYNEYAAKEQAVRDCEKELLHLEKQVEMFEQHDTELSQEMAHSAQNDVTTLTNKLAILKKELNKLPF